MRGRAAAEILTCCRKGRKLLWYLRVIMDAPNYVIQKNENDHTTLVNAVNKLIDEGYTPLGGLTVLTLGSGSLVYISGDGLQARSDVFAADLGALRPEPRGATAQVCRRPSFRPE